MEDSINPDSAFSSTFVFRMLNLLTEIKALQSKGDNGIYPDGIFSSQRIHKATGIKREDDNSFFTALIVFTLNRMGKYLSEEDRKIIAEINTKAQKSFPLYKSKKVEGTYNFWRVDPHAHFPNGKLFSKFNHFALADDADCTALIYLSGGYSQKEITHLKERLVYHSSITIRRAMQLPDKYKTLKLYSTWFGKYIPIEVDVCVICNLLYLIFESKTELTDFDIDSIKFVCSVINLNEYLVRPFSIAPFYPKASIIIYHASRLLTVTNNPDLLKLKEKLVSDSLELLKSNIRPMERVILNTSIMWLGNMRDAEYLQMPTDTNFPWFIAGMLSSIRSRNKLTYWLAGKTIFHLQFYCEAYMKTLFLEYKMLKDNVIPGS